MAGTCPSNIPHRIGCGIINEHMAVRTGVGIFDVSHMGDIRLAGPQALSRRAAHLDERRFTAGNRSGSVFGPALSRKARLSTT